MKIKEHAREVIYEKWDNGELVEVHYPKIREWKGLSMAEANQLRHSFFNKLISFADVLNIVDDILKEKNNG